MGKHLVFFFLSLVLSFSSLPVLAQSTCVVDRLTDTGEGSGLMGDLRYCITNAISGEDSITFEVTGTINLAGPLPDLNVSVTIEGPGADLSTLVQRAHRGRIFTVGSGATVLISGLTISNGFVEANNGGGILNSGTLTISNSAISGNFALGYFSLGGSGGGIYNAGTLTINNSIISNNSVFCTDPAYGTCMDPLGGGIFNSGTLTISESSISGNGTGGDANCPCGGGIYNSRSLTINNSTASNNRAEEGGGIYNARSGTLNMRNTIVAGNRAYFAPDLSGSLTSSGYNLIGNTIGGSGFDETDLLNVDPLLGPLQDNGGPTFTHALLPGSPAIDAGDNTEAPEHDQRGEGFLRIVNGIIDIGAYEVQEEER